MRLLSFLNIVSICRRSSNKVFSWLKVESHPKPSKRSGPLVVLDGYRPPVVPVARPPSLSRPRVLEAEGGRGHDLRLVAVALETLLVAYYLGKGSTLKYYFVLVKENSRSSVKHSPAQTRGRRGEEDHIPFHAGAHPSLWHGV